MSDVSIFSFPFLYIQVRLDVLTHGPPAEIKIVFQLKNEKQADE